MNSATRNPGHTNTSDMMRSSIGIDLGGTHLRAVRLGEHGEILAQARVRTAALNGPASVVEQICRLVEQMLAGSGDDVAGMGVCVAGPVDPDAGLVLEASTMTGWHNIPLRAWLAERTGLAVLLANDANAAALGEWRYGAGQGCRHFVYVTVSTGIGGGVIADGRLLLGHRGMAGEVGHMVVDRSGPRCNCGAQGCWEAVASGTALAREAGAAQAMAPSSLLHRWAQDRPLTAREVVDAARQGDALARQLVHDEGAWLGIGLAGLLHLYAPERIAVGGGLSNALDLFLPQIEHEIRTRTMPPYRSVPVVAAALGDHAGVVGAGALVLEGW